MDPIAQAQLPASPAPITQTPAPATTPVVQPPVVKPQVSQTVQSSKMLQCTCVVRLSKDHEVPRTGVTPIEAMLLVAEHNKNVGSSPIDVEEITDVKPIADNRTIDQELDRLRARYGSGKVKALISEVREMPTTFEAAVERGIKISLPSGAISTTKLM